MLSPRSAFQKAVVEDGPDADVLAGHEASGDEIIPQSHPVSLHSAGQQSFC